MVLISHRYKFIYIKNYKVAGTSVEAYFEKYCLDPSNNYKLTHSRKQSISEYGIVGNRLGVSPDEKDVNIHIGPHMSANDVKSIIGEDIFNSYFKFCVIRNPYDRMVSSYYFRGAKVSFADYVKKTIGTPKPEKTDYNRYLIDNKPCIDFYIRYEHLEKDLETVCKKLNIEYDISRLPSFKSNIRKDKEYRKYYNEELKQIIYENHKAEFELHGYQF